MQEDTVGVFDRVRREATVLLTGLLASFVGHMAPAHAERSVVRAVAGKVLMDAVVVTARKRAEGQQDVPVAISAFNADQLEAMKVRELEDLSCIMPSVSLDDVSTQRGTANISIRGFGLNASILSIDPTVGVTSGLRSARMDMTRVMGESQAVVPDMSNEECSSCIQNTWQRSFPKIRS